MKVFGWVVFGFFAIGIGLYPIVYVLMGSNLQGLLASKPAELLADVLYRTAFYLHISFGGLSLLAGWTQFSKRLRNKNLLLHRRLGKIYVIAVCVSGLAGFHIAMYANGGMVSVMGFSGLAIAWLFTTTRAFLLIQKKNADLHQQWMIRSYAMAFAAVTLRIYLPTFPSLLGISFDKAYTIIAWACWVPNLIVAEFFVASVKRRLAAG